MLNVKSIIFNGKSSEDFGLKVVFTEAVSELESGLAREAVKGTLNARRNRFNYFSSKYSGGIELEIIFMKGSCGSGWGYFSIEESTLINEWLTANALPSKLHAATDDTAYYDYYAIVTNIQDIVYGSRAAKRVTFETDSPFATSSLLKTLSYTVEGVLEDKLYIDTAVELYPKFIFNGEGEVSFSNITDKGTINFNLDNFPDGIIVDSDLMRITDGLIDTPVVLSDVGILDSFDEYDETGIYWPRLLPEYNELHMTGNYTLEIQYQTRRKVGVL
jgi:hypothetical protein